MSVIATEAGVGRATVYRYFPTREALERGLLAAAIDELATRIADADLGHVPVAEGFARLTRGFLAAGAKYTALAHIDKTPDDEADLDRRIASPLRDLITRGVSDGTLRDDVTAEVQFEAFTGLLEKGLGIAARGELGIEQASAAVVTIFLDGARSTPP